MLDIQIMKGFLLILAVTSSAVGRLQRRDICTPDSCGGAVTGNRCNPVDSSSRLLRTADCSSFMIQTVTPATPTTTTTISSLTYSIVGSTAGPAPTQNASISAPPAKRDVAPKINKIVLQDADLDYILVPPSVAAIAPRQVTVEGIVPPYATGCADPAAYSSACSCAGITTSTTTAPTPATATETTYATVVPVCDPALNNGYQFVTGGVSHDITLAVSNLGPMPDHDCCAHCYIVGSKCFVYEHTDDGNCIIVTENVGNNTKTATDWCPLGVYNITSPGNGTFFGQGPCAVFD